MSSVPLALISGASGGSVDETPLSLYIIQNSAFQALACYYMAAIQLLLLLAFLILVVNIGGKKTKQWEMREDETSSLPSPLIYSSQIKLGFVLSKLLPSRKFAV